MPVSQTGNASQWKSTGRNAMYEDQRCESKSKIASIDSVTNVTNVD